MKCTKAYHKALKAAYTKAVAEEAVTFTLEGDEYLTSYAKYLLEYLEPRSEIRPLPVMQLKNLSGDSHV